MPRYITPAFQEYLQGDATTTTILLRVEPVTPGFAPYGATLLNRDVVFNDGDGELTYLAPIGMQPAAVIQTGNMSINNTEMGHLLPEYDFPISEEDIRAGAYDYAKFRAYLVNYEDLSMGFVEFHAGTIGQVRIRDDGLSFVNELLGLAARLKQSICEKDSLTCRAVFGSQPIGSPTPGPQVRRGWCGYDATQELVAATVLDIGAEARRTFQVETNSDWVIDHLNPGMTYWATGRNAGRAIEIESNTADGWITLAHELAYPIENGDALEYREDCNKHPRDTSKGCKRWFGVQWGLHFRGEPNIPIGDAGAMETPGASSGPGQGGHVSVPLEEE